ncbi:uncharacterized protein LOC125025517 [Penaeus chinensis]|uniref:uncharacterized protein LOC125025517 n=1 Tax=Penaeus chinensis TaxID=139456 RepID=UPI001FB70279|nr:uncharacterized protein LOC125025517 [Penaeus chinensis]
MTEVRCAVGTTEAFPIEVGLHQGSALSPFLFAPEGRRMEAPWQMMFADDVVLCAREKGGVLEDNLEQWRDALEERGMKISRSKTEYMCLSGLSLGSVNLQDSLLPVTDNFKYLGSTIQ